MKSFQALGVFESTVLTLFWLFVKETAVLAINSIKS